MVILLMDSVQRILIFFDKKNIVDGLGALWLECWITFTNIRKSDC